jgi:hypothetical protein
MSGDANIIEIDSIVLTGVDLHNADRLNVLIEAEVLRVLSGTDLQRSTAIANSHTRIAGEVAQTVVRSVQGGADRV